ncbi:hypothetical protein [Leptothoe kymatousa]|uniref:Uncharacterized protein n=1 Tax=Leptothoe kymatousa TAU-MAC 1615 TaxID=2364775 RepID=A0ABS5Y3E1_9CYAN|nr:hypothetical protein [Leptothoe kymatousa]MBT9312136.1 hypothetical protein [Leptothoe kymatousa TAU-MAC 1615]
MAKVVVAGDGLTIYGLVCGRGFSAVGCRLKTLVALERVVPENNAIAPPLRFRTIQIYQRVANAIG